MNNYIEGLVGDEDKTCVNSTFLVCDIKDRIQQALLTYFEENEKKSLMEIQIVLEKELKKIVHEGGLVYHEVEGD